MTLSHIQSPKGNSSLQPCTDTDNFGMAMKTYDSCAPSAQSSGGMAKWALAIIMVSGFVKFVGQRGEFTTGDDMVMKTGMMNSKAMKTMTHWRNWSQIPCSHF